jgi:hypothetical protein
MNQLDTQQISRIEKLSVVGVRVSELVDEQIEHVVHVFVINFRGQNRDGIRNVLEGRH